MLFNASQIGAKASVNLFRLIETDKVNLLRLYAYLNQVFKQLPNAQTIDDVDQPLPLNLSLQQAWCLQLGQECT